MQAPGIRILAAIVPCLALGLVLVCLRRMALYDDAFGLTMLRLWVMGVAAWMGAVLLFVAARNAGIGTKREWVLAASALAGVVLVLVADVADPEAFVVRHNVARAERGAELDARYLALLSDDATPAIVAAYDSSDPAQQAELEPTLRCGEDSSGVTSLNVAARRAASARRGPCAALHPG